MQDDIKTMMIDFINKRSKIINFKTFKTVLLATINSMIVTASLLINLYISEGDFTRSVQGLGPMM